MEQALIHRLVSSDAQVETGKIVGRNLRPSKSFWCSYGVKSSHISQPPSKILSLAEACKSST